MARRRVQPKDAGGHKVYVEPSAWPNQALGMIVLDAVQDATRHRRATSDYTWSAVQTLQDIPLPGHAPRVAPGSPPSGGATDLVTIEPKPGVTPPGYVGPPTPPGRLFVGPPVRL